MEPEIDCWSVAEALRARGCEACVEGGGTGPPLISVCIGGGRSTMWNGDSRAWFASFVGADGDEALDNPVAITAVAQASTPDDIAKAISATVRGL